MITNFEEITQELSDVEMEVLPLVISGFRNHKEDDPIKAPDIVKSLDRYFYLKDIDVRMTEVRLRKFVNYIRTKSLLPLIATSKGYFVTEDPQVLRKQIRSLHERANSIKDCAHGLEKFLK